MKKLLFVIACLIYVAGNAQDNWQNTISHGFKNGTVKFDGLKSFNNKLYLAGDSMNAKIVLYSSVNGDTTSASQETGLNTVLQGSIENSLPSMISNNSYLFLGSGVQGYYKGAATPQVYRYDKTNYVKYGTINYSTLPLNNSIDTTAGINPQPRISNIALYSPTGSNDTIYSFLYPSYNIQVAGNGYANISVWKAPATLTGTTTPTWVNSTNFSPGSGITSTYDVIVWNKKLYLSVNTADSGGAILRSSNGVTWDTVLTAASLKNQIGVNYGSIYFSALEIYKGKLVAALTGYGSGGNFLISTTDSVAQIPVWNFLTNSNYSSLTSGWSTINDLQVAGGKLWIQVGTGGAAWPAVYDYSEIAGKDTVYESTRYTNIETSSNQGITFKMEAFKNNIYTSGTGSGSGGLRLMDNHQIKNGLNKNNNTSFPVVDGPPTNSFGITWRFNMLNPTPTFTTATDTSSGYCVNSGLHLTNTSVNGLNADWYLNDTLVTSNQAYTIVYPSYAGIVNVKMISYNGTNQSQYKDSIISQVTIYANPVVDSVKASSLSVCQGQQDSLKAFVSLGTAPFSYTWLDINNPANIFHGNTATTVATPTNVANSPSMSVLVNVKDAHQCLGSGGNLNIQVNAADNLIGLVSDTNHNAVTPGTVYLFKQKTSNVGVLDTVGMYSLDAFGSYNFPSVYYGNYYLKAVPDPSNTTLVGTYYSTKPNAYQWNLADTIKHYTCLAQNDTINIKMLSINTPTAVTVHGIITGTISSNYGYGMRLGNNGYNQPYGSPLKGADVKLGKSPGGGCSARTTSDNSGGFTFTNVDTGSYKIYVDIPNFGMDSVRIVSVTLSDTSSTNNNYYVDSTMIRVLPTHVATASICNGDSILVGHHYHRSAGVYYDTLQTPHLHDSLIITTLTVNSLPTLTITASSNTVCAGTIVTLTGNSLVTTYTWSTNNNTATISVSPTVTSVYTLTVTDANNCKGLQTKTITVNPMPDKSITTIPGVFTYTANAFPATYQWINCSSHHNINGATSQTYASPAGSDSSYAVIITQNNCTDTSICYTEVSIGITSLTMENGFNIYPNPASGMFTVETNVAEKQTLQIFDVSGKLVFSQVFKNRKVNVDGSSLSAGVYNINIISSNTILNDKLIITK